MKRLLADCRTAAEGIFMGGADPGDAGKPCTDALSARADAMSKEIEEADRRKNAK